MVLWLWSREGRELSSQRFSCQDWSGELGESCHGQTELDVWVSWEAFWWLGAVVVGMKESELIFGMKGWKIWDCGKIDRVWKNVLDLPVAFSELVTDLSSILVSNWPWARMAACTHSLFCLWFSESSGNIGLKYQMPHFTKYDVVSCAAKYLDRRKKSADWCRNFPKYSISHEMSHVKLCNTQCVYL